MQPQPVDLLQMIDAIDVEEIDNQIDMLKRRLKMLAAIRRGIETEEGPSGGGNGKAVGSRGSSLPKLLAAFKNHATPLRTGEVVRHSGVSSSNVHKYLKHHYFKKEDDGWVLTASGQTAAAELGK